MMYPKLIYHSDSDWMFPMELHRIRPGSTSDRQHRPLTGRYNRSTIDSSMEIEEKKEICVPVESLINSMRPGPMLDTTPVIQNAFTHEVGALCPRDYHSRRNRNQRFLLPKLIQPSCPPAWSWSDIL